MSKKNSSPSYACPFVSNPSHPLASSQVTKPQNILQPDWKRSELTLGESITGESIEMQVLMVCLQSDESVSQDNVK